MSSFFGILLLASIVGLFKPYIPNSKRWHFGVAAVLSFLAVGATAPEQASNKLGKTEGSVASSPKVDQTKAFRQFEASILDSMKPCDDGTAAMMAQTEAISKGNSSAYEGYNAALAASNACRDSAGAVSKIEAPDSFVGKAEEKAEDAVSKCRNAAYTKKSVADKFAEIFNGDMRPSMQNEAIQLSQEAQMSVVRCVAMMYDAGSAAGVSVEEFAKDKK